MAPDGSWHLWHVSGPLNMDIPRRATAADPINTDGSPLATLLAAEGVKMELDEKGFYSRPEGIGCSKNLWYGIQVMLGVRDPILEETLLHMVNNPSLKDDDQELQDFIWDQVKLYEKREGLE